MTITVNGAIESLTDACTLPVFLQSKGLEPKTVVVEINGDIPDKAQWNDIVIKEGDTLEILKFMGGG